MAKGLCTADIKSDGAKIVPASRMGEAIDGVMNRLLSKMISKMSGKNSETA